MKLRNRFSFLLFDKRRCAVGMGIALVSVLACGLFGSWKMGILFAVMFLAAGCIRFRPSAACPWEYVLWGAVCVVVSSVLPSVMLEYISILSPGYLRVLLNCLVVAAFYGIWMTILGRVRPAMAVASTLLMVMATVNVALYQFQGNELKPTDFLSIRTAMNVAGHYSLDIKADIVRGWLLWLWTMFCLYGLPSWEPKHPKRYIRLAAALTACLCLVAVRFGAADIATNNWLNGGTKHNGYFLNFYIGLRDGFVQKPENYSPEAVAGLADRYEASETKQTDLPNILVIMNESFADLEVLGSVPKTNMPVTPYVDSMKENMTYGYAMSSVFGGNTANSEFEFLTGGATANLPQGSIPYQQHIYQDVYSLPWLMDAYGYRTVATHPYNANGWNRPAVYSYFGFSECTFKEDYPRENKIRNYVSDQEMYEYVVKTLKEPGEKPLFLFGITMQNHGDYSYVGDGYTQTIFLEEGEEAYPQAEQYLSLLHESDKALEYLFTELESFPEKTVVMLFGDHLPRLEDGFFRELHGGDFETLSDEMLKYKVPFFIWANYDIPTQAVECTSLSYLSRYLLEAAGLDLPPYYQFLEELEKEIPAVNAMGYYSKSRQTFLPLEEAEGEEAQWLNRYAMVQYNNLFDKDNRNPLLFQQYLTGGEEP